jgi:ABC-2 type transport system ATP-binding protein
MLTVTRLAKRFGDVTALADVSFTVAPREILGVIGPNGAGKTTLLECVSGLLPVDAGEVAWSGARLAPGRRKAVLFCLPDGITPWPDQSVRRLLGFVRELYAITPEREHEVTQQLALAPALDRPVAQLSKGYRRRMLLALALLGPQPVLMLDEPFDGLDLRQTLETMALLRDCARGGRALVLSIHQLTDAARVCDRLLLLAAGRTLGLGTLPELRERAAVPSTASLEDVFLALT